MKIPKNSHLVAPIRIHHLASIKWRKFLKNAKKAFLLLHNGFKVETAITQTISLTLDCGTLLSLESCNGLTLGSLRQTFVAYTFSVTKFDELFRVEALPKALCTEMSFDKTSSGYRIYICWIQIENTDLMEMNRMSFVMKLKGMVGQKSWNAKNQNLRKLVQFVDRHNDGSFKSVRIWYSNSQFSMSRIIWIFQKTIFIKKALLF